ncbi:MAG: hypothetical protein IT455_18515 [Planctomycetes bacterium]|nr:hypothetical protein [Planctomycetota bacterium]
MNDGMAMTVARQRQLDWLLDEVLAGGGARARTVLTSPRWRWFAAAAALVAVAALAFGLARDGEPDAGATPPQEAPWRECHGPAGLDAVPADTTSLRGFDFDDAACAKLARLTKLERLDLSGMDVDARGVARSLPITDAGVRQLGALTGLRWLSLGQCEHVQGGSLAVLEALPRLEHLDLHSTRVDSAAVERLARLPNLRWLSLSYCRRFHGRSLAAVASLPGLTHLELRGCTTLAAADVMPLAKAKSLRSLDLRDCQGRYRGQTGGFDEPGSVAPDAEPREDGIGITDAVVEALASLPLDTLRLGGCDSLTAAIGPSLATMTTLRTLDLSELERIDDRVLSLLPAGLVSLSLRDCRQLRAALPALPELRMLDLTGIPVNATDVQRLFGGRTIETICLGSGSVTLGPEATGQPEVVPGQTNVTAVLAAQRSLRRLSLRGCSWLDAEAMARLAALPLQELTLDHCRVDRRALGALSVSKTMLALRLRWCSDFDPDGLQELGSLPLGELDLTGTHGADDRVRDIAARAWRGCLVTLGNSSRFRTP